MTCRNPLSSQVISNATQPAGSPALCCGSVVIPYQVRSYQTLPSLEKEFAQTMGVVIPYQVRSYQTSNSLMLIRLPLGSRRNPLSSQVISNAVSGPWAGGRFAGRNPLSSQVISNVCRTYHSPARWPACRNPLSSQVISNREFPKH